MSPAISKKELIRKFRNLGYTEPFSGTKQQFIKKGNMKLRIPNPQKNSDIDISLIKEILKQANISYEKWSNA